MNKHMTISSMHAWEKSSHMMHVSLSFMGSAQALNKNTANKWSYVKYSDFFLTWLTELHTFFPQQEIQEVVGVGHPNFCLHLRPSEGGVNVARATPLFCLSQLREPTPHISVRRDMKRGEEVEEEMGRVSKRPGINSVSKYKECINTSNRVRNSHTQT